MGFFFDLPWEFWPRLLRVCYVAIRPSCFVSEILVTSQQAHARSLLSIPRGNRGQNCCLVLLDVCLNPTAHLAINFHVTYERVVVFSPLTPCTAAWKSALPRKCRCCPGLRFPLRQQSWLLTLSQDLGSQHSHDRQSIQITRNWYSLTCIWKQSRPSIRL